MALLPIFVKKRSPSSPTNNGSPQDRPSEGHSDGTITTTEDPIAASIAALQTPIEFYGKVVDQHGDPVSGASVKVLIIDNESDESKPKMMLTSDADGRFSVKGIKGLAIDVVVKKESYLTKSDQGLAKPASSRLIAYGLDGSGGARFKDPDKPTLFTLHKLGPMEPLVYVTKRRWKLATDGTARNIALDTEKGLGSHQIEFQFTTDWAKIPKGSAAIYRKFDWKLEMRISGGGFCKSRSDYLFEAPDGGYEEKIRVNHPKDHSNWSTVDGGRYFVRFSDGTYGKIRFTIDGNSDFAPLMMTSWMNLKPGSRNLNSDKRDSNLMLDE